MSADEDRGSPLLPYIMVFFGCMTSIFAMEKVLKSDPNAGNMLNATEFVFVLLQSVPGRLEAKSLRFRPLRAPLSSHVLHALLWVTMSTLANYAFAFNISVPIHTLFRSCNVITSVVIGYLAFGHRYSFVQLICAVVITVGIFCGSIGDAKKFFGSSTCIDCASSPSAAADPSGAETITEDQLMWTMGIAMLVVVQMFQATLGHTQAVFYKRYQDKGTRNELADEYLFSSHVASLLMILVLWEDIVTSFAKALTSDPLDYFFFPVPRSLFWMVVNNFTQLCCIKGVFRLAANYSPLTVTITLACRKSISVVVSILWFGNTWTHLHSIGMLLIFGGVFAYSQCPAPPSPSDDKSKKKD